MENVGKGYHINEMRNLPRANPEAPAAIKSLLFRLQTDTWFVMVFTKRSGRSFEQLRPTLL
jgi:hypothetical protein